MRAQAWSSDKGALNALRISSTVIQLFLSEQKSRLFRTVRTPHSLMRAAFSRPPISPKPTTPPPLSSVFCTVVGFLLIFTSLHSFFDSAISIIILASFCCCVTKTALLLCTQQCTTTSTSSSASTLHNSKNAEPFITNLSKILSLCSMLICQ